MQIFKDTTQCFLLVVLIQQKENTFDLLYSKFDKFTGTHLNIGVFVRFVPECVAQQLSEIYIYLCNSIECHPEKVL
jgi:hypothetical protein